MSDVDGRWWDVEPDSPRPRRDTPGSISSVYVALAVTREHSDGLDFFRGLKWAALITPFLWALIIMAFILAGCVHTKTVLVIPADMVFDIPETCATRPAPRNCT